MSDKTDMGGPAFPVPMTMDQEGNLHHSAEHPDRIGGMTLWDYYAASALPAFIAHPGCPPEEWPSQQPSKPTPCLPNAPSALAATHE